MGYIRGIISEELLNEIVEPINPDTALEFQANEFRKIYYFFGLYCSFCSQTKQNDFDKFLSDRQFYSLHPSDNMNWANLNKGVQFIRDRVLNETACCSGVMLRKLAYKSRFRSIAIACNADEHISAILHYTNHCFHNKSIEECFIKMLSADFERYIDENEINLDSNDLEALIHECQDFSLTFQIIMLQNKNTEKARRLLGRIRSIPEYRLICNHIAI